MPMRAPAPFSPVTVMVIVSSAENVSAEQANEIVLFAWAAVGVAVHDPDGG
jgi:hypothetical protein